MSNEDNRISEAGDFVIEEMKLLSSTGKEIPIAPSAIVLYEDTNMSTISGDLVFANGMGLSGVTPLIGQEFLKLKIRTPSFDGEDVMINYADDPLALQSISSKDYLDNGVETVSINFVTSDFLKNMKTKLKKKVEGSYSDIVTKILKQEIKTKKKDSQLFISETVGNKKVVIPDMRPFDFIQDIAMKDSISKATQKPGYVFFETFRGYVFKSFSDIFATETVTVFDPDISIEEMVIRSGPVTGTHDIIKGFQFVADYEISQGNDILLNHASGVYGSKLLEYDILNKNYEEHIFDYFDSFSADEHIDKFPAFSKAKDEESKKISEYPVRTFLHHKEKEPATWLQRSFSQRIQMEQGYVTNALVRGNTAVSAGDTVEFDIPLPASLEMDDTFVGAEDGHDPLFKGRFFVKRIKHTFDMVTMKHSMLMTLIKDALPTNIEIM